MSNGLRIHHIGVVVDDISDATAFLTDVLGITVGEIVDLGPGTGRVAMAPCGPVQIELIEYADPERRRARLGDDVARIEHIAFDVADAEKVRAELAAKGVGFAGPTRVRPDCTTFFTTPETCDGVMYQFRQPHDRGRDGEREVGQ
jgi:catechol 2,3-dioxygenase-like lactoylglutathione lyase family enzyme